MTYHPKSIMPCAVFLATKTDNFYMSLREFANGIPGITKPEEVIAPEFTLTQGLRFTFDVRHPFRGLEGAVMELQAIAQGEGKPAPHHLGQTPESLKQALHSIPRLATSQADDSASISARIGNAHGKAREILKTAAQMTDAYFFYTPSQIWLSAFFLADQPLAQFFLDVKIPPVGDVTNADPMNPLALIRAKLLTTLSDCSKLLESYTPVSSDTDKRKRLKGIAKKVYQCQQIEKMDPATPGSAHKRTSGNPAPAGSEGISEGESERAAKKRKLERERREKETRDIFGGELVRRQNKESEANGGGREGGIE
jgi:cyclin H